MYAHHTISESVYQVFQLLGIGWNQPISLRIPAAIRNSFAVQSDAFIQTIANSEIQMQFQLMTLSEQHPKSSQICADNTHPGISVL